MPKKTNQPIPKTKKSSPKKAAGPVFKGEEFFAQLLEVSMVEERRFTVEFMVTPLKGDFLKKTVTGESLVLTEKDFGRPEVLKMDLIYEDEALSMEPDKILGECMDIYDQNEDKPPKDPVKLQQWKIGQYADHLTYKLVDRNLLAPWFSFIDNDADEDEDEDEECCEADKKGKKK